MVKRMEKNPQRKILLGVDIGGTKTRALLVDENGSVLGFGKAGPGNHESVGWDGLTGVGCGVQGCRNTKR
jgi:activator of 2-hydroxyglutaryl-CoA dehydratase